MKASPAPILTGAALLAASLHATGANPPLTPEARDFFEKRIRPVLVSECTECHGTKKQKGGLRLDFRDGWKKGGESGDAILPGDAAKSLLIRSIRHEDPDLKMPEKRPKLSDAVIADFEKWIALGAPDPRDEPPKGDTAVPWETLLADRRTWWSLQPVRPAEPPAVKNAAWSQHPVDRFLLAKMEERGLSPVADADPRTIIRRLSFALTGLPPAPEEVEAFVLAAARDPQAAIRAEADRLLASPRFGERWARHWMDLVRYAESHGSEGDPEIPNAWRYRDYLVRAFNGGVPLDRLIREHLAGDLLPEPRWNRAEQFNESILGIAHLRLVEHGFQPVDTRDEQVKTTDSQIDVAMKAFQALTVSCARCHDHKFDAISQRDYYALAGIFESSRPAMVAIDAPELLAKNKAALAALKPRIREALAADWKAAPARIAARLLAEIEPDPRVAAAAEKIADLERKIAEIDSAAQSPLGAAATGLPVATGPRPLARWTFETDARDANGTLHGKFLGGARIEKGRLILDGKAAHFRSAPLARDIRQKTLEAWVSLATLDQSGGGVVTIEDANGKVFDAIVFAEKEPRHWVAGSNNFRRSKNAGGPEENSSPDELIHIAITYGEEGMIAVYRNGAPYGNAWKSSDPSPVPFTAGDAHVLLGRRHTGGGRPFLAGEIEEARLYDRALTPEELLASFRAGPSASAPDTAAILATLPPAERARREELQRDLSAARETHAALSKGADAPAWTAVRKDAESNPGNPFHLWAGLQKAAPEAMAERWAELRRESKPTPAAPGRSWSFAKGVADFAACFHYGTGIDAPVAPGEFAILPEGEVVLAGLLPAGVVTNTLSTRHNGVLTTRVFKIETDWISIKAWGGGGAQARLIVDGYPLGTNPIFPRAQLAKDEPGWLKLDTKYRKGSPAYIEFATAMDQTRREKSASDRSWFGVSEIVCHNGEGPRDSVNALAAFATSGAPRSAKELANRYEAAIATAIEAWRKGSVDEPQRLLLDFLIRRKLLPTALAQLPAARPLVEEYRRLEAEIPAPRHAPGVLESIASGSPFLPRGDHLKPGEIVPRGYLGVFGAPPFETRRSGRLELAAAITDSRNPLTARVMANRIWHHVFGRGLVATPDNFGRTGTKPTHPELLDWLAARLIEEKWSLKDTLRLLVTSRAFLLESAPPPAARGRDAENDLLSHARVRRLDAESIRDSLLAVSGRLDLEMSGPPPKGGDSTRRSIYLQVRRNSLNAFLETFDAPKPFTTTGRRDATNVPAQSLTLLNDPFVIECARHWAQRIVAGPEKSADQRIRGIISTALARPPSDTELASVKKYLGDAAPDSSAAWADIVQSVFNLKEFIYLR